MEEARRFGPAFLVREVERLALEDRERPLERER